MDCGDDLPSVENRYHYSIYFFTISIDSVRYSLIPVGELHTLSQKLEDSVKAFLRGSWLLGDIELHLRYAISPSDICACEFRPIGSNKGSTCALMPLQILLHIERCQNVTCLAMTQEIPTELIADAISWRQHLHRFPELAYHEFRTADFIAAKLDQFGLTVHRGLGGTGVVGTLTRGVSRRTIAIRADMDALRIRECTGAPYASCTDGIMHACGHDGHVAIALAAARACANIPDLNGTVHFIFQPAEEGSAGARRMVEDGLFKLFPCDAIYALHNWPALLLGSCVVLDGAMMAANAMMEIEIFGRGCHGAMPHEGTDSLLAGCQLVSALQSIVSRNIDPLEASVVSATQIHAGDAHNVIPDRCVIRGTARWFHCPVGHSIERRVTELSASIAAAFGCEAKVQFERRYPATINDPSVANFVRSIILESTANLTLADARPSMGAEDFAFMLREVPGCYIWLGAGKKGRQSYGLHSSRYDFNDEALSLGVTLWLSLVRRSLS